jgi:hypothetical protein
MKLRYIVLAIVLLVGIAGGALYWRLTTTTPQQPLAIDQKVDGILEEMKQLRGEVDDLKNRLTKLEQPPSVTPEAKPKPETEEEKMRRMVLGIWQDKYQGKRTMTLNADGTGVMHVELSGASAFLFASKMRFDMKWKLEEKKLTKTTIGGEPADKVNLILNTMGNVAEDTLLEVTEERLHLLDKNGKTKYDWRRAKQKEPNQKKEEEKKKSLGVE